jgi:hypothetical protein
MEYSSSPDGLKESFLQHDSLGLAKRSVRSLESTKSGLSSHRSYTRDLPGILITSGLSLFSLGFLADGLYWTSFIQSNPVVAAALWLLLGVLQTLGLIFLTMADCDMNGERTSIFHPSFAHRSFPSRSLL